MPSHASGFLRSRRTWVMAAVVALAVAVVVARLFPLTPYQRGMEQAALDHRRGRFELQVYGGPPLPPDKAKEEEEFARLVKERYGVELHQVAGCVVTDELLGYADGYNSVSERLLKERFGKDVFDECRRQTEGTR